MSVSKRLNRACHQSSCKPIQDCHERSTIGYCGSWLPRKGTELIKHDLPLVLREFPDWRLQLIGVGDAFDKRHHFPADVLPQIDVLPFVFQKSELIALYQNMSIFIFPSTPESFGMVLAEAMACGCAAIAAKLGFSASLHNGTEILHLNNHAPGALRDQLRSAILDDELRARIAAAGGPTSQATRLAAGDRAL